MKEEIEMGGKRDRELKWEEVLCTSKEKSWWGFEAKFKHIYKITFHT